MDYFRHNHPPPPAVFALAQHHGIPTRLLDFTYSPLVAAYFAAEVDCEQSESICVHAVKIPDGGPLQVLRAPRFQMQFPHAQDAASILMPGGTSYYIRSSEWPSMEMILEISHPDVRKARPMRRVLLHRNHREDLLRILWNEGISRAHLMPTLDNIALAVRQFRSWEQ